MSQRDLILARLKEIAKTASVVTVEVFNYKSDYSDYFASDLPMVQIVPGAESPRPYQTGKQAKWVFPIELTCAFLDDIDSESQQEKLTKEIKDVLGEDSTLNDTSTTVDIMYIRPGGEFPVWEVLFSIEITYIKAIDNA